MAGVRTPKWTKDSWREEFGERRTAQFGPTWPDGSKMAVALTFDTHGDIDAARPNYQSTTMSPGGINYMDQMERHYEVTSGIPRILRLLDKFGIHCTFPMCGATAAWYPDLAQEISGRGHEVAAHGYWHHNFSLLNAEEQHIEIRDTAAAISDAIGIAPTGFRSPMHSGSGITLDAAVASGIRWVADFANDDDPYWIVRPTGRILAVPSCLNDLDMFLMPPGAGHVIHANGSFYNSGIEVLNIWKDEFAMLQQEALLGSPKLMVLTLHPRITGRPFRTRALERFLEYVTEHDGEGVWFPRIDELLTLAEENSRA
jgi:peptidoglycan/xylan/chitin deacetylase (PgdA/CDA1 family)